ncbi:DUF3137 domain-containing protein [Hyphomonas sp.]|jgi:hypothetical protein|uniref:DUF3137 domain-containing protein n=1 Tax=Hyphomonas sp. TaxID=87 RepID=UPI003241CCF5
MDIGNSSHIDNAIRRARPLSLLASQRPEFADAERIWETELAPELGAREAVRKQTISRAKSRTFLGLLVAVPLALFIMVLSGGAGFLFPLSFFLGAIIVVLISGFDWLKVYSLKSATKDLILKAACKPFGFNYETLHPDLSGIEDFQSLKTRGKELMETIAGPQKGEAKTLSTLFGDIQVTTHDGAGQPPPTPAYQLLKDAALLPGHSRRKFEDLIEGERAGTKFALVEAKLDTGGKNSKTVFQGILIHIEYPQRFSGRTLMARSGWWKRGKGAGDLKKVDLISRELDEAFTVYSSDQVEARALLSPDRMERLIALERHFSGGKLRGLFDQGHMTLALEADNQFEAGSVFQPLVDPRRFSTALSELGLVCDLIDGFLTREWVQGRL